MPASTQIEGVTLTPLKIISDERGAVLHMLRADAEEFTRFGEVYFSETRSGVIKGWKRHRLMTQRMAVPMGRLRIVIFDDREDSPTRNTFSEYVLGRPSDYALLTIPPLLWYGFQAIDGEDALIANCPDLAHQPDESETRPLSTDRIPYTWPDASVPSDEQI